MEKYDTSQLTEFPRFESESSQSGVTTFLNKLWKFPIFTPSESADAQDNKTPNEDRREPDDGRDDKENDEVKTETGSYVVEYEGRSLPNILKRISGLAALGSGVSDLTIFEYSEYICSFKIIKNQSDRLHLLHKYVIVSSKDKFF